MICASTEKELDERKAKLKAQFDSLKEEFVLTYDDTLSITIYSSKVRGRDYTCIKYYEMINTPYNFYWRELDEGEVSTILYHDVPF